MTRRFAGSCLVVALCSCGSGKDLVVEDLPPPPSERVKRPPVVPDRTPPVADRGTRTPGGVVSQQPGVVPPPPDVTVEGVDAELVRAWKSSRDTGVVFDQQLSLTRGAIGDRVVRSRVQVLGDRSRRDDLAEDGTVVQSTVTLPDDVIILDHAPRTWATLGGRLDKIAKDASAWYFQREFLGLKRWTRLGQEVVDGVLCEVYEKSNSAETDSGQVRRGEKVWFARDLDGFAMRYESNSFLGIGVTVVRSEVHKAAVRSADLQVPSGYARQQPGR